MYSVRPTVCLAYTIKPVIYGMIAAWLAGVQRRYALITGLGYAFTGRPRGVRIFVRALAQFLYTLALKCSHKVFFQNHDDRNLFLDLSLLSRNTPCVIVNGSGVDLSFFTPSVVPKGPPHFLLIARLLGDKGVREYAMAAKQLKTVYPELIFSLAG